MRLSGRDAHTTDGAYHMARASVNPVFEIPPERDFKAPAVILLG